MFGNATLKESLALFQGRPSNLAPVEDARASYCCLTNVGSLTTLSDSSSATFECQLRTLNLALSKISIA